MGEGRQSSGSAVGAPGGLPASGPSTNTGTEANAESSANTPNVAAFGTCGCAMIGYKIRCASCGRTLAHVMADGEVVVKYKTLEVIGATEIRCPICGVRRILDNTVTTVVA